MNLLRRLAQRLRPTLSVHCLACKRPCPTTSPAAVLAWLDNHRCAAATRAARAVESVITGRPPRW